MATDFTNPFIPADASNPWPRYSQYNIGFATVVNGVTSLSSTVISLSAFDPTGQNYDPLNLMYCNSAGNAGGGCVVYARIDWPSTSVTSWVFTFRHNNPATTAVFALSTNIRELLTKSLGVSAGWKVSTNIENGVNNYPGADPCYIYINPIETSRTAWERRRLVSMGY